MRVAAAHLAGLGLALASAAAAAPTTLEELEACLRANEPADASVQTVVLRSWDRAERINESRARIYWKRFDEGLSRVMMRMTDPPPQRGAGVLLIEKKEGQPDLFMYLPAVKRVQRVTTRMVSGSLFGTDFSYEDFERLQGYARDQSSELQSIGELEGRPVLVVENRPTPDSGSAYERVSTLFDQETCVPLESRLYERGEEPRKVVSVDRERIEKIEGRHVPRRILIRDLRDGTRTELVVEEVEFDAEIHRKVFSQRELEAGAR